MHVGKVSMHAGKVSMSLPSVAVEIAVGVRCVPIIAVIEIIYIYRLFIDSHKIIYSSTEGEDLGSTSNGKTNSKFAVLDTE